MARDPICPICNGDLLMSGDEAPGEQVFCPTCNAPCLVRFDDDGEAEAEADF